MNLRRDMTEQRGEGEGSHPINPINSARQMSFRMILGLKRRLKRSGKDKEKSFVSFGTEEVNVEI